MGGPQGGQKLVYIDIFVNCICVDSRWQQYSTAQSYTQTVRE